MTTNKRTIGNTPYEQVVGELRDAVPGLQVIAEHAYALAASTAEEGGAAASSASASAQRI